MKTYEVIRRPIISEKATALSEVANRYAFEVGKTANKQQIKEAVQQLFQVKVTGVRTMIVHGKVKRAGQTNFKKSNWKKAIVSVAEGQKIDFFQTK